VRVSALDLTSAPADPAKSFPRSVRLTQSRDYQRVFSGAKRLGDRHFTVLATPNTLGHARLGLAVSRRNAPRAVDRNRLKRLVRESFRCQRGELAGYDLVVLSKPAAVAASNEVLRRSLAQQWQRLRRA
jgi:ribonuclease P protein component